MGFASDDFSGVSGTELHTYNALWNKMSGATESASITSGGRVAWKGGSASTTVGPSYYYNANPTNKNYRVQADIYVASQTSGGNLIAGVCGRVQSGAQTYYQANYTRNVGSSISQWRLWRCSSGSFTQLGSGVTEALTTGNTYPIKLEMTNGVISLFKNNEADPIISLVDTTITSAGQSGLRVVEAAAAGGDAIGLQIDNFLAEDTGYPVMSTYYACAIRGDTGAVIFSTLKDSQHLQASTTKVMTALVACQHAATSDVATMPADLVTGTFAGSSGETNAGPLATGEQVSLGNLLTMMFHPSGGDATRLVGAYVGGTYLGGSDLDTNGMNTFITEMNTQAAALGMSKSAYVNTSGDPQSGQLSSAYDLCLNIKALMEGTGAMYDAARAAFLVGGSYITTNITSHHYDQLADHFGRSNWPGVIACKGGLNTNSGAGEVIACAVGCAQRGSSTVYFGTMHPTDTREADVRALLDYAFAQIGATTASATTTVQDGCSLITTTWTRTTTANDTAHYSEGYGYETTTTSAQLSVALTGRTFNVYCPKGPNLGIVEVFLDGVSQGTVDLYNASWQKAADIGPIFTVTPGDRAAHTLMLSCTGTKNASSSSVKVAFDYFSYSDSLAVAAGGGGGVQTNLLLVM